MNPASILLACLFGGLAAGGLRSPGAWTVLSAVLWLLVLKNSRALSWKSLEAWLPWLLWALLSATLSSQPLKCLYALSRWSGVVAFFVLARSFWGDVERRLWFEALCLMGLFLGLAGLWTGWVELMDHGSGESMTGLLPPYYNYTVFVEAALAAGILAVLSHPSSPEGRHKWALSALGAAMMLLMLIARARAGLLAAAAAGLLTALRQGRVKRLVLAAGVVAAVAVSAAATRGLPISYLLKLDKAAVFKRPEIWRSALQIAGDHPLLGEGPGNFQQGFARHNFPSRYRVSNYQYSSAYAHSEPLQLAAETGWVGLALFLWALALSLKIPKPSEGDWTREAALAAGTAMAAQCLVDNMLQMPALAMLFFSSLACAHPSAQDRSTGPWGRFVPLWGGAGLLLALSAWIPGFLVQRYGDRIRFEEDSGRRLELAQKAASLFPADDSLREDLARAWLETATPRPDLALAEFEKASALNPTNAVYLIMRAELLRNRGMWVQALELAQKAVSLEPNCLQARLLRAEAWARGGRRDLARAELSEVRKRRSELEKARLYARDRNLYTGYDFTVGSYDAGRFARVSRLAR